MVRAKVRMANIWQDCRAGGFAGGCWADAAGPLSRSARPASGGDVRRDRRVDHVLRLDDLRDRPVADVLGEVAGALVAHLEDPELRLLGDAPLGVAELLAQPAPGVEPASRRGGGRRRHVALQDEALLLASRIGL